MDFLPGRIFGWTAFTAGAGGDALELAASVMESSTRTGWETRASCVDVLLRLVLVVTGVDVRAFLFGENSAPLSFFAFRLRFELGRRG